MACQENTKIWFSRMVKYDTDALYGVALRLTGDRTSAEDLVAETVIKAWSCIDHLEDRGRWRPWVFRILRNGFISNYRKQSRHRTPSGAEGWRNRIQEDETWLDSRELGGC